MLIYLVSFAAGVLAAFSPCILPVLPIVVGSSSVQSKKGPVLLAVGLIASLTLMGLIFSSVSSLIGLDERQIRIISASLLILFGVILLFPKLKEFLLALLTPISNRSVGFSQKFEKRGSLGQLAIGFLLGMGWSPCVGPALGIAMTMAADNVHRFQAGVLMLLFGMGLSLPLLGVAYGFRTYFQKRKSVLLKINMQGNKLIGFVTCLMGILMLTGVDKKIEALLVSALPEWYLKLGVIL